MRAGPPFNPQLLTTLCAASTLPSAPPLPPHEEVRCALLPRPPLSSPLPHGLPLYAEVQVSPGGVEPAHKGAWKGAGRGGGGQGMGSSPSSPRTGMRRLGLARTPSQCRLPLGVGPIGPVLLPPTRPARALFGAHTGWDGASTTSTPSSPAPAHPCYFLKALVAVLPQFRSFSSTTLPPLAQRLPPPQPAPCTAPSPGLPCACAARPPSRHGGRRACSLHLPDYPAHVE